MLLWPLQLGVQQRVDVSSQPLRIDLRQRSAARDEIAGRRPAAGTWSQLGNHGSVPGNREDLTPDDPLQHISTMVAQLAHRD